MDIEFHGDDEWSYDIHTTLLVHGRPEPFDHRDHNRLKRVAHGKPNPLQS